MTCRLSVLFLILACCFQPAFESAASALTIGSWNLQNFLIGNRFENGGFLFSYPMPESRKQRIRSLILAQHPDMLFLQEVGSAAFLLELQRDLSAAGLDYPYSHFSGIAGSRSGLAFLSRIAPSEVIFHDIPLRRGIQEVRLFHTGTPLRVFHVHLKSRYSDDPEDPQAARARSLEISVLSSALQRFLGSDSLSRMVLLGDFNTPFDDALMRPLWERWRPLPLTDSSGNPNTYFHRAGHADILDGFWVPAASPVHANGSLLPLPQDCPSDHRFLLLHLPSPS